jgi:hypothetical protein
VQNDSKERSSWFGYLRTARHGTVRHTTNLANMDLRSKRGLQQERTSENGVDTNSVAAGWIMLTLIQAKRQKKRNKFALLFHSITHRLKHAVMLQPVHKRQRKERSRQSFIDVKIRISKFSGHGVHSSYFPTNSQNTQSCFSCWRNRRRSGRHTRVNWWMTTESDTGSRMMVLNVVKGHIPVSSKTALFVNNRREMRPVLADV